MLDGESIEYCDDEILLAGLFPVAACGAAMSAVNPVFCL